MRFRPIVRTSVSAGVFALVLSLCADCGSPVPPPTTACVPGKSTLCGGPNGCVGFQVCSVDGGSYGPCECPESGASADAQASDASAEPACIGSPTMTSCADCCAAAAMRGGCPQGCCAGCTLTSTGTCTGTLAPCSELSAAKCTNQDGCMLAQSDAATTD